jgi:hypothetical protein
LARMRKKLPSREATRAGICSSNRVRWISKFLFSLVFGLFLDSWNFPLPFALVRYSKRYMDLVCCHQCNMCDVNLLCDINFCLYKL